MKMIKIIFLFSVCFMAFCAPAFAGDIVIYGDSQIYDDDQAAEIAQRSVVQAILEKRPSIVFRVGDIVHDGHDPHQWEVFNSIAAGLLKTTEYYPCLGNHEGDSSLYFDNFKNINRQHWYSVDRQGIRFIVLDSNSPLGDNSPQYTWLEAQLAQIPSGIEFIIALFHHPMFNVGGHGEDEQGLKPYLVPLFEKYGVGAVFSGHDHNYQRVLYNGIEYVVAGGGGSHLYDPTRTSPYLQKFSKSYHFCLLSRGQDSLKVEVFSVRPEDAASSLIDEFTIPSISKVKSSRSAEALFP
ncbi:MAG: metallophosphoesterase [Candidatus Omnitrophota bacterium]